MTNTFSKSRTSLRQGRRARDEQLAASLSTLKTEYFRRVITEWQEGLYTALNDLARELVTAQAKVLTLARLSMLRLTRSCIVPTSGKLRRPTSRRLLVFPASRLFSLLIVRGLWRRPRTLKPSVKRVRCGKRLGVRKLSLRRSMKT